MGYAHDMEPFDHLDPQVRRHRAELARERERTGLNEWMAARLQERREQLGISRADLAARVGKSEAWVSRLESPASDPRFNELQKVLTVLRLNLMLQAWPD
jgi:ribosome-binding protein aMBF1 (putative translation factor)